MNQEKTLLKLLANQANNPAYGKPENIKGPLPKFAVNAEQAEAYEKNNVNEGLGEAIRRRVDSYVDNTIKENMPSGSSEADFENTKKALALAQDAGSFIGSIKAVKGAGKLAMDQASRMARAKKMGFDVDLKVFHGSPRADIESFKPSHDGGLGEGVYFATDPNYSNQYANFSPREIDGYRSTNEWKLNFQDNFNKNKKNPEMAKALQSRKAFLDADSVFLQSPENKGKFGPTVYPATIKTKNIVDFDHPELLLEKAGVKTKDELTQKARDLGMTRNKYIKSLGFDGLKAGQEYVVFDPKNIRSVNAAFDPKKANSKNILAGALAVTSLSQLLKEDK